MLKISLLIFLLLAAACSTFSKKECEDKDWMTLGYETATGGRTPGGDIAYYKRECGDEHGVPPDVGLFNKGYESGLKEFCTADNGLRFGRSGGLYNNTCPAKDEKSFLEKYQLGRIEYTGSRLHELEDEVRELKRQNDLKEERIRDLEKKLKERSG